MTAEVDAFMDEYIRRYSERDVEGVAELCLWPFLAIREGVPIHMSDREAVRDHFAAMIDAYRGSVAARTMISARSGDRIVGASSGAVASGAEKPYVHVVRSDCSKGRGRK